MIAVCGATGRIGQNIVHAAVRDGFQVRAVIEPGVSSSFGSAAGLNTVNAAFEDYGQLVATFRGASSVLLLTPPGTRQVWWQRNIIDAAVSAGADRIVKVSAYASRDQAPTNMGRWHFDGELALADSGVPHVVVRPQYFMDNLLRTSDQIRSRGVLSGVIPPTHGIGMIDVRDVAAVCYQALLHTRWEGRVLVPTGPEPLNPVETAARMSAVLGREIRYEFLEHDRARSEFAAAGVPRWRYDDMLAITSDCGPEITPCVLDVTGSAPRTIEDFAVEHRDQLI